MAKKSKMSKEELVEIIAEAVVDGMDMDSVLECAKEKLVESYSKTSMKQLLEIAKDIQLNLDDEDNKLVLQA